ncbi:MAG: multicopper oxidase domain-containing protein, partial [Cyanobacteria bacterium P01_F01_bin.150]
MINRRQFIRLVTIASGAPLLSQCLPTPSVRRSIQTNRISSVDGLLDLTLTSQASPYSIDNTSAQVLTYNGQIPGPLLEAKAGDTVRLTLNNQLNTPTNLHYHGLHISPEIDNVFRKIAPGDQYTYEFQIPSDHPATTAWYHPHYHLNVAEQVFGGLAGPFIIRGDVDTIPEIAQAEETVLVLQDFGITAQGTIQTPHALASKWGREGDRILASGQANPIVSIPQNGLLRLRLINASASRIYKLQLQEHPWFLMATDRGAISQPLEQDTVTLSPGERAEFLISGQSKPGDYRLINLPYDRGLDKIVDALGTSAKNLPGVVLPEEQAIATLRYQSSERTSPLLLPQQLIAVEPLSSSLITREFILDHGMDASAPTTGFTINGKSFAMDRVNTQVKLNQIEDWHIV